MPGTLEQFALFGTDNIGLERILRLIHSICILLISYPLLLASLLSNAPASVLVSKTKGIAQLRDSVNVTRRFVRLFRFLDSFQAGWTAYVADGHKSIEDWLGILCQTFLGIYGGLETMTALDVLQIEGLRVFGPERTASMNRDAMIFWFAALYTSVVCSAMKLFRVFAYRAVPQTGAGYGTGEKPAAETSSEKEGDKDTAKPSEKQALSQDKELRNERERLKGLVSKRKEERQAWIQTVSTEATGLVVKMVSDMLDMLIPSSIVGWVKVDPGLVGLAMLCTTFITSYNLWKKCGQQLQKKKA